MTQVTPPDSGITIYAELLANIGQVSVAASLSSVSDSTTRAEILENGTLIRVGHRGLTQSMTLPAPVSISAALPTPKDPSNNLNWRLPLSPKVPRGSSFSLEGQALPWNAVDIQPGSRICCRKCHHAVIETDTISSWKDLPSENWAEMMEFWHCHKPHDHDQPDEEHLTKRGYGASNAISAQPGVGFVDITSFVFSESDCRDLLFSLSSVDDAFDSSDLALEQSQKPRFLHIYCKPCRTEIGLYNVLSSSAALFKWQVSLEPVPSTQAPTSCHCLAATLTATISRSGSAKSVILPHAVSDNEKGIQGHSLRALHLWVLSPSVVFNSSLVESRKHAMKILYQVIDAEHGHRLTESMTSDVQDISLPTSVIEAAQTNLESSTLLLPAKERTLREWRVGLLERWDSPRN